MTMFYENVRLALFSLKANKMRALLTMLGIIIGISSVIAIMTVGDSISNEVSQSMSDLGGTAINMGLQMKWETDEDGNEPVYNENDYPKDDDYFTEESIRAFWEAYSKDVVTISVTESVGRGQIVDGSLYANINLTGCSYGTFVKNNTELLGGRFFSDREVNAMSKVVVISSSAVDNMFDGDVDKAIGQDIEISVNDIYDTYHVVGVYKRQSSVMDFQMAGKNITTDAYIPLPTAKKMNHTSNYESVDFIMDPNVDMDEFCKTIKSYFSQNYKNTHFEVYTFSAASIIDSMSSMMNSVTVGIAFIAGIALLVGGIGVMNIMLVSITERTREIGTRKALGAPNSAIRMQFIIESVVVCVIGGIIGIILGIILGNIAVNVIGTHAVTSLRSIFISLGFSMAIGVFFGYYPANKAAKMNPIDALRYE